MMNTYEAMKVIKVTDADARNASDKAFQFALRMTENADVRKAEAGYLARMMTGQQTWQGIKPEMQYYSGLAAIANKYLATTATTLRIRERRVNGDGTSMYELK